MRCSKKSSYSAAEIIEGNDDLLIQLVLFFPATSLIRFTAVNKRWRLLISDPVFRRRHTAHRRESEAAFILGGEGSKYQVWNPTSRRLTSLSPPLPQKYPLVKILRSCNGLLLLRCRKTKNGVTHYYIFNPTTMQLRDLFIPTGSFDALYLIFDPSLSPYYRVVLFNNPATINVHVYNSESDRWKCEDEYVYSVRSGVRKGKHLNGGVYFYKFRSSSTRFVAQAEGNVAENIRHPPRHQSGGRQKNYVMESNGFLLCLTLSFKNESNLLHVSEMKGFESGWTNKYKIDTKHILGKGENCVDAMDLLGVIRGEKEQDSLLLFRLKWKKNIMFYRFCDGVFQDIVDYNSQEFQNKNPWFVSDVHHFIPSFAPV